MALHLKRAYEEASADDGRRYLVERLWPRGVAKAKLPLTAWLKDLAPSTELRRWYGHEPERWPEFARRYQAELQTPASQSLLLQLAREAEAGEVTLIFATKATELSGAAVLADLVRRSMSA